MKHNFNISLFSLLISRLPPDGVVSYSMPQGDKRGATWEMFDATYDGHWDGQLQRGLGQLTDGRVGPDNFKMGYYDYERGEFNIVCMLLDIEHDIDS